MNIQQKTARNSAKMFKPRYGNFINGRWAEPLSGKYFENTSPVNGLPLCEIARSDAKDVEAALDAAHAAKGRLGAHQRGGTRRHPQQDRPGDGRQSAPAGRGRNLGQRQADPRNHRRRHAAGHRSFPLFRRRDPGPGRRHFRNRPRHRRLSFSRTAGRRRPDHPLELPHPDGDLETRAGAGRGQLRRAQAGGADPGLDPGPDGIDWRPAAARRSQYRQRLRPGGGQAAGVQQPRRQDRLHRRDHHRPADHAICQPEPHSGDPGTGRQVAQHLLQGRRRRGRRFLRQGDRRLCHVRAQPGRGVHLPQPRADP